MANDYVLNHDYGYDNEEQRELNRLTLRNLKDVEDYVIDIIENFIVYSAGRRVWIADKNQTEEAQIELIK